MKMKNRQNNKHQSLCTTALSMLPQARGSRHSHEASTTEKLKAARKEAHPTTEGTASLSISFGQREKKKKSKGNTGSSTVGGAGLRTGRRCSGHTAGGAQWTGRSWPLG